MKLSIHIFLIISSFFVLFLILGGNTFQQSFSSQEEVFEEAIPIRQETIMTGLRYIVKVDQKVRDSSLTISSHILDSILHYMEIEMIDQFMVQLEITASSYQLKNLSVVDTLTNVVVEDISYFEREKGVFVFELNSSFFKHYQKEYVIFINLEKERA